MSSFEIPIAKVPAAVHGRSLWDDASRRLMRNRAAVSGMIMPAMPGARGGYWTPAHSLHL